MIAATAFLLGFIVLALGVLALAMRSGSKGKPPSPPSSRTRRFVTVWLPILMLITGAGFPTWIMAANSEGKIKDAVGGVELSSSEAEGRQLFAEHCSTCHTLRGANATGRVGPNLDNLQAVSNTAFTLNAIEQGRAQGRGQMPAALVDGQDAEDVADFIKAVAGR